MNRKILIIILLAFVAIAVGIGYAAYNREQVPYTPPFQRYPEPWQEGGVILPTSKQESAPKPIQVPTKSTATYDSKKVNACMADYQAKQKKYDGQVAEGHILVGFPTSTPILSAKAAIQAHGLKPREGNSGFYTHLGVLFADLPSGSEYLWSCRLRQDSRIRYAEPDFLAQAQTVSP